MKKLISCLLIAFPLVLPAQVRPAEILSFLKKNFTIFYIENPNTVNPDIREIKTSKINLAAKGVVFGTATNRGMDVSAQLLTALFNEQDLSPGGAVLQGKDGDLRLQETVYYALQVAGKPVTLFFINDKVNGVEQKYWSQYSMHAVRRFDLNAVWSGAFPMKSPAYAGTIVLGEYEHRNLQKYKEEFISLITRMAMGGFGAAKSPKLLSYEIKKTPPTHYQTFTFGIHDTRLIASQAIGNAFAFYYAPSYRQDVDAWVKKGGYYFLPVPNRRSSDPLSIEESQDVPPEFSLQNKLLQFSSKNVGYNRATYVPDIPASVFDGWIMHSDFLFLVHNDHAKYKLYSDYHLGIRCHEYIQKNGIKKFADCLKAMKSKWMAASPEEKIGLLATDPCIKP